MGIIEINDPHHKNRILNSKDNLLLRLPFRVASVPCFGPFDLRFSIPEILADSYVWYHRGSLRFDP